MCFHFCIVAQKQVLLVSRGLQHKPNEEATDTTWSEPLDNATMFPYRSQSWGFYSNKMIHFEPLKMAQSSRQIVTFKNNRIASPSPKLTRKKKDESVTGNPSRSRGRQRRG